MLPFGEKVRRLTADTVLVAHAQPGSKTEGLAQEAVEWGKQVYTLDHPANNNLLAIGVLRYLSQGGTLSTLERAIAIAAAAHAGATDKGGQPYILHPLRVMLAVDSTEAKIAAVLHDVVEDTDWTLARLYQEGFSETVLQALDALTRRENEDYLVFVRRARINPISRQVKIADLTDNMDLSRLPSPTARDLDRIKKYKAAVAVLISDDGP